MALSTLVRKSLPALMLLLLGSSAYQVASGLWRFATSAVEARTFTPRRPTPSPESSPTEQQPTSAESPLKQAPFAASRAPALPVATRGGYLAAPDCETIAAHIVTESADRSWSLASLSVAGEARPRLCRVGDEVAGHRVEFIGFNPRQSSAAVWLSNPTRVCQASLAARGKLPTAAVAEARSAPSELAATIAKHVERLSETEVNLSRAAFQTLFENVLELGSRLRVVPETKDGRKVGMRLFGVRPGTWLSALGIQNGDRVESINGFDCTNPEKLMEGYARLGTASELSVKLTRQGKPMLLEVHVR